MAGGAADDLIEQAGSARSAPVESLRAVAALAVLAGHVAVAAPGAPGVSPVGRALVGGTFGVALFFALSGYLLYLPFARRDFGGGRRIDLPGYARNRALRVLPLYVVSVGALLVVQHDGGSWSQWWRFLLLAENFSAATFGEVNAVLWSVVVEVHFYALLPLLALGIARFAGGSPETAAAGLCLLGAVSYGLYGLSDGVLWRSALPALLFFFVAGMLLALLHVAWDARRAAPVRLPQRAATWLALSVPLWIAASWRHELAALTAVAAFLTVGAAVLPLHGGRARAALAWRPLALVGVVSYSVYVWHLPIVESAARGTGSAGGLLATALPLALAAGAGSYLVIERPFLRLRRRWGATPGAGAAG